MKNSLFFILLVGCLSLTSCLTDNSFFTGFDTAALELVECQTTFQRPFTTSIQFTTTYVVENADGTPVANARIHRNFRVHTCDGNVSDLSFGFVITNANGRYTETDNFSSNYTNDKIIIDAELRHPINLGKQQFRSRARDGGTSFTFIIHDLED